MVGHCIFFLKDEDDDGLLGVEARGMFYVDPLRIAVGCLSLRTIYIYIYIFIHVHYLHLHPEIGIQPVLHVPKTMFSKENLYISMDDTFLWDGQISEVFPRKTN